MPRLITNLQCFLILLQIVKHSHHNRTEDEVAETHLFVLRIESAH